ncbi:phosphoribosylanthranilate isomerase [Methylovirgula ligni]|uniref:N-(5'-phosphoribosyl)anthranilate isomerase n=1 Tax=Methylovirgula ligni TaxID=569860 RepID=A0A3D9YVG1_9HYPH|nr:phosphoribosylanthranilate isomerase [Methylovirgula ligni]QAY95846.1 phosphoribosylanthranilate isomerase [Methylovirgula ligni]REF86515.1 phosphoribosylanthranilate isomerase [Methylovirgula ligni]
MGMIVKICGLSTPETLGAALAAGADMVGFVHFPKSPRHVPLAAAAALAGGVAGRARKVLLTVDAGDDLLAAAIAAFEPDILQLHGHEPPARVAALRAKFGRPVMKAIGLASAADVAGIADYEAVADLLLFDALPADVTALPGGNGRAFDWALLRGRRFAKPWLIGGGLTAETVGEAIRATGASGVDVSSGVESARGVKDIGKIASFIAAARAAEKLGSLAESG